jgi:hypothetical protein
MKVLSIAVSFLFLSASDGLHNLPEKQDKSPALMHPEKFPFGPWRTRTGPTVIGTGSDQSLLLDEFGDLTVSWYGANSTYLLSRSQNNGASWSTPVTLPLLETVETISPEGPIVAIEPGGPIDIIYICFEKCTGNVIDASVQFIRSTNKGQTWTAPQDISLPPSGGGSGAGEAVIAACGAGAVVVWTDDGIGSDGANTDGLLNGVMLRYIAGGVPGQAINLSKEPNSAKGHPQILVNAQSNVFVTWVTDNGLGDNIATDSIIFAEVPNCGALK